MKYGRLFDHHRRFHFFLFIVLLLMLTVACSRTESVSPSPGTQAQSDPVKSSPEMEIITYRHPRRSGYGADFTTHGIRTESFSLYIADRIYEEELLLSWFTRLQEELDRIQELTGTDIQPVELFIVAQTVSGIAQTDENRIYCTPEDMDELRYREFLLTVAYGLQANWQCEGLKGLVYDAPADEEIIRQSMNLRTDHSIFSCFPAYYEPRFSDEDDRGLAEQLAQSIAAYLLETHGFEVFLQTYNSFDIYEEWCETKQVTPQNVFHEGSIQAALVMRMPSDETAAVWANPQFVFRIGTPYWMQTADEAYDYICRLLAGFDCMTEDINERVPEPYRFEGFSSPLQVILDDRSTSDSMLYSHADRMNHRVYIYEPTHFWHETAHILFPMEKTGVENAWLCEAVATEFAAKAESMYGWTDTNALILDREHFREVLAAADAEDEEAFISTLIDVYLQIREDTDSVADVGAYRRAGAAVSLLRPELHIKKCFDSKTVAEKGGYHAGAKERDGNGLTYAQAMLFFEFLTEQYGMDVIMNGYFSPEPLEQFLGQPYTELYRSFYNLLQERYGGMLFDNAELFFLEDQEG